MPTFVLVHGAFFGSWCWDGVADLLRDDKNTAIAPTLTGLAERAHLLSQDVDLDCHTNDVVAAIDDAKDNNIILVGHSYGGMPAMAAADRRAKCIQTIVFLDAYVPGNGQSAHSIRSSYTGAQDLHPLPEPLNGAVAPLSAQVFGLTGKLAESVDRRLTPHPYATITQPIRLTGKWQNIPAKHYMRTSRFAAPYYDQTYNELVDATDWHASIYDCEHCPMLTEPAWLADLLRSFS